MIVHSRRRSPAFALSRILFIPTPFRWLTVLLLWIAAWTFLFSALDFWTIKLWDVCNWPGFQEYRSVMRYGVSWVSPPSFALAENTYFFWVNTYDRGYTMHEWDFYKGDPFNPDGKYNFVWGDPNTGGWVKFPMSQWYSGWAVPSAIWLIIVTLVFGRRRWILPGERMAARLVGLVQRQPAVETEKIVD